MRRFRPGVLIALALAFAAVSGCSDSNGPGESLDGQIRFVNGISNTVGTVTIGLEGDPSAELEFSEQSVYASASSAFRNAFASDAEGVLRTGEVFLSAGSHYTMAFVGHADIDLVSGIFLADDPGEPDVGKAFIRVAQGGLQTGIVDVYILEPGEEVDGAPTVPAMNWLDVTLFGEFASGEVTLVLTKPATPDSIRYSSGPLSVPSQSTSTLLLVDSAEGDAATELIFLDDDA